VLNEEQCYRRLPYFCIRECSTLSFFEEHILSVRMGGLSVVSVILVAYCLVMGLALTVLIFRQRGKRRSEAKLDTGCVGEERDRDKENGRV
jgi:hypothetical protein